MKLSTFKHFDGQHCESTTTGCLLRHIGVDLSEPMLFGLGEGLGYLIWNMKTMDFPFIGGRVKPDVLTANLCRNLNLTLNIQQTASAKKAWTNVVDQIDSGNPVGLKLDCYHLDYFTTRVHFAGHYVAMYDYDDEFAYLVDTRQQGGKVKTPLVNLAKARSEKGPMSSKNLSYTIVRSVDAPSLSGVVRRAINNNATAYLNPPIRNFGYSGVLKTSREIKKWFAGSDDRKGEFQTTAMLMERAGTGGALFRNLYRDFLYESSQLESLHQLQDSAKAFESIATQWTTVADLFHRAGETDEERYIIDASKILIELSAAEKQAMENLLKVISS